MRLSRKAVVPIFSAVVLGCSPAETTNSLAQHDHGQHASPTSDSATKKQRKIKHWIAPMDPTFVSEIPGKSPMGMDLVPVYERDGGRSTITIDPEEDLIEKISMEITLIGFSLLTITVEVAELNPGIDPAMFRWQTQLPKDVKVIHDAAEEKK